jgi:glycosyltransferase involved in cell wall biosynthesis
LRIESVSRKIAALRNPAALDDRVEILYITNGFPYPLTSGYLRHYHFIRELSARGHRITLLSLAGVRHRPEDIDAMRATASEIHVFRVDDARSLRSRLRRRLQRVLRRDPAVLAMAGSAARLVATRRFDAVISSGKQTIQVLDEVPQLPLVVDMTDATSVRLEGAARHADPLRRRTLLLEAAAMRRVESDLLGRAHELVFAAMRDCEALTSALPRGPHAPATVIPNGVDLEYWHRTRPQRGSATVVFTGGMNYPPNTDAAMTLIRDVMPLVWSELPDVRLTIVGRDPTPGLRAAATDERVTVTGFVEDVRPYLDDATVFAAPLRFGAGIQNKLLEAMAFELPVVASSVAADGLRVGPGIEPPIRVVDEPVGTARALLDELRAQGSDATPRAVARAYVAAHFDWALSGSRLDEVVRRAAAAR